MDTKSIRVAYFVGYAQRMTGSQRSLLRLVLGVADRIDVRVFVPEAGEVGEYFARCGVNTTECRPPGPLAEYGGALTSLGWHEIGWVCARYYIPWARKLRRMLKNECVDIVHCNDQRALLMVGPAARLAGVPVVLHARSLAVRSRVMEMLVQRTVSVCICVAKAVEDSIGSKVPTRVIYNSVGTDGAQEPGVSLPSTIGGGEGRENEEKRESGVVFLLASTVTPFKGHHVAIKATGRLRQDGFRVKLKIVGEPRSRGDRKYLEYLEELSEAVGVSDSVMWLGWTNDIRTMIRESEVVLVPTLPDGELDLGRQGVLPYTCSEGLPRVALEAMAQGRPVIGSRAAGIPEAVREGETGFIVEPGDEGGLAQGMKKLVEDARLRDDMGKAGRARAREFSDARLADEVMGVYDALVRASD